VIPVIPQGGKTGVKKRFEQKMPKTTESFFIPKSFRFRQFHDFEPVAAKRLDDFQ
jgi:hypothetical protein